MITWPSLFLILAVLLGILYIALGVIANSYVKQDSKMKYFDWVMSLGVSWAFFDDRYETFCKKITYLRQGRYSDRIGRFNCLG
jgi:hypothetical protein